jgi:lysophospholipase L1-like esterase
VPRSGAREVNGARYAIALSFAVIACTTKDAPGADAQAQGADAQAQAQGADAQAQTQAQAQGADAQAQAQAQGADAQAQPAAPSACNAPSVRDLHAQDDARDLAALASCTPYEEFLAPWDEEQPFAADCGRGGARARKVDLDRMIASALPLDDATAEHVRAVFAAGKAKGRRADLFGLVGDSITIDHSFLRPFSAASPERVTLAPAVREALRVDASRTVIDLFRGVPAPDSGAAQSYDAFRAPRAAKIGARIKWALSYNGAMKATPVEDLVTTLSPAYAVVMFGTNDAQWYLNPPAVIAKEVGDQLRALVDALESRGVVTILTTIPKHMRDKRFADCPVAGTLASNRRYAIQTNVVSATIADVACERRLPLIDYRFALDPLLDHGVAADGVHPSLYYRGGGVLDENGLQCGFNVRNFVTLRMLKLVVDAVANPPTTPRTD